MAKMLEQPPRRRACARMLPGRSWRAGALLPGLAAALLALAPAALAEGGGSISGVVASSASHAPVQGALVCALTPGGAPGASEEEEGSSEPGGEQVACAHTGAGGEYTVGGLASGSYLLVFGDPPDEGELNYVTQYYDARATAAEAQTVSVTSGATTAGIDAALAEGAEISGTLTSAATGAPVEGGAACALPVMGLAPPESGTCAFADAQGDYTLRGLPSGSFQLEFFGRGFAPQFAGGAQSIAEAKPLAIVAGERRSSVSAALHPGGVPVEPIVPGGGPVTGGGNGSTTGGQGHGGAPRSSASVSVRGQVAVRGAAQALAKVRCRAALGWCRGAIELTAQRIASRRGLNVPETVAIGAARYAVAAGRTATVKLALTRTGRELLRAAHGQLAALATFAQSSPVPPLRASQRVVIAEQPAARPRA